MFKKREISLLLSKTNSELSLECKRNSDRVYALFLEPHPIPENSSLASKLVHYAINHFQPSPVMVHVELVIPCPEESNEPVNFATYIGEDSKWQVNPKANEKYYLGNGKVWRAVPVFGDEVSQRARCVCSQSVGIPYSLLRYLTASWPFRDFARWVGNRKRSPAHCATLSARILKESVDGVLKHPSAWYGPATLYSELRERLSAQDISPEDTLMSAPVADAVNCILRKRDEEVLETLDDTKCEDAFHALALKVVASERHGDTASQELAQRQLAVALLRWGVLRSQKMHQFV